MSAPHIELTIARIDHAIHVSEQTIGADAAEVLRSMLPHMRALAEALEDKRIPQQHQSNVRARLNMYLMAIVATAASDTQLEAPGLTHQELLALVGQRGLQ